MTSGSDWTGLVERIQAGEPCAEEELYLFMQRTVRWYLLRRIGNREDADDRAHDVYIAVLMAIRECRVRQPEALPGYIFGTLKNTMAKVIGLAVSARNRLTALEDLSEDPVDDRHDPERQVWENERAGIMAKLLNELRPADREVLVRFYVENQPAERIQAEMCLSATSFRLLKSRAKAKFSRLTSRHLEKKPSPDVKIRRACG